MGCHKRRHRNKRQSKWRELERGKSITELIELYQDQMIGRVVNELIKHDFSEGEISDIAMHLFERASDGAQESWSKFKGDSSVRTWLFKIQHNKIKDFWRRRALHRRFIQEKRHRFELASPYEDPAWIFLENERIEQLREAILSLPATMREVIDMLFIMQMDREEVRNRLGLTPSALDTRVSRAYAKLRFYLIARGFGSDRDG